MKTKTVKFSTALEELDQLLEKIDQGKIDLDDLPTEIAHANELIQLCQEKIKRAEVEVRKVLADSKQKES